MSAFFFSSPSFLAAARHTSGAAAHGSAAMTAAGASSRRSSARRCWMAAPSAWMRCELSPRVTVRDVPSPTVPTGVRLVRLRARSEDSARPRVARSSCRRRSLSSSWRRRSAAAAAAAAEGSPRVVMVRVPASPAPVVSEGRVVVGVPPPVVSPVRGGVSPVVVTVEVPSVPVSPSPVVPPGVGVTGTIGVVGVVVIVLLPPGVPVSTPPVVPPRGTDVAPRRVAPSRSVVDGPLSITVPPAVAPPVSGGGAPGCLYWVVGCRYCRYGCVGCRYCWVGCRYCWPTPDCPPWAPAPSAGLVSGVVV